MAKRGVRARNSAVSGSGRAFCGPLLAATGALAGADWDETRQAKWLTRRIVYDLALGVDLTSYFLIVDLVGYRGSTNWKGLLRGDDAHFCDPVQIGQILLFEVIVEITADDAGREGLGKAFRRPEADAGPNREQVIENLGGRLADG